MLHYSPECKCKNLCDEATEKTKEKNVDLIAEKPKKYRSISSLISFAINSWCFHAPYLFISPTILSLVI